MAAPLASEKHASNLAGSLNIDWKELTAKLPTGLDADSKAARDKLWSGMDMNGNGYMSLAELDKGVRDVLQLKDVFAAKPVMMRAFQAAKGAAHTKSRLGPDFVEKGKEFRLLLHYIRQYFELYTMFDRIDTDDDRRIDSTEFRMAVPMLKTWGIDVKDPAALFAEVDSDGGGMVLFDEFSRWAMIKGLDLEDDDDAE